MVLRLHDAEAKLLLPVYGLGEADRIGALGHDNRLALQVGGTLQATIGLDEPARLADERRDRKRNLLLSLLVVRRSSAFDIDGAVLNEWNSVRRVHRRIVDGETGQLEVRLDLFDDCRANIQREPNGLLIGS